MTCLAERAHGLGLVNMADKAKGNVMIVYKKCTPRVSKLADYTTASHATPTSGCVLTTLDYHHCQADICCTSIDIIILSLSIQYVDILLPHITPPPVKLPHKTGKADETVIISPCYPVSSYGRNLGSYLIGFIGDLT